MLINKLLSASAFRRRYPLGEIVIQGRSCSNNPTWRSGIIRAGSHRINKLGVYSINLTLNAN